MRAPVLPLLVAVALGGCSSAVETLPGRTATEQLLLSHAADKAAVGFWSELKPGTSVFIEARNFNGEASDYALSALRQALLAQGGRLAPTRDKADVVCEIRQGALSMDQTNRVVGIPAITLPVTSNWNTIYVPEMSLYSRADRSGVAEFTAFAYDAKTGEPVAMGIRGEGSTQIRRHKLLMIFSWGDQTVRPGDAALDPQPWWKLW